MPKETADAFAGMKAGTAARWAGRGRWGQVPTGRLLGRGGRLRPPRTPSTKRLSWLRKGVGSLLAASPAGVGAQPLRSPRAQRGACRGRVSRARVVGGCRAPTARAARGGGVLRGRQ